MYFEDDKTLWVNKYVSLSVQANSAYISSYADDANNRTSVLVESFLTLQMEHNILECKVLGVGKTFRFLWTSEGRLFVKVLGWIN